MSLSRASTRGSYSRIEGFTHLKELVLTVSSVGVDDDEALGLKLLVVGWLVVDEAFLELDLSMVLVEGFVVGVGVVESWLLEKP